MADDDWRITVEVEDVHERLLERLGVDLDDEARELARELEGRRLVVSRDGDEIFVYASSPVEAAQAQKVIEAELRTLGVEATMSNIEHWLEDEERWDDEPTSETWEQAELDRGFAPWEVRVECSSRREAHELAERLEAKGYKPERRFRYLIVGAASKEDAETLAAHLHGEVEAGGEVVWEAQPVIRPSLPIFTIFGGLGR